MLQEKIPGSWLCIISRNFLNGLLNTEKFRLSRALSMNEEGWIMRNDLGVECNGLPSELIELFLAHDVASDDYQRCKHTLTLVDISHHYNFIHPT